MNTYLFLDTNVYLHFIQFDQIKWKELLNIDDFTIVMPITVISELDKRKIDEVPRISKQAKMIIKLLESYNRKQVSPELVKIIFLKNECNPETFKKYSLDNTVSDDRIIASILEFKEKNNGNAILIAYGFGIKLKAGSYNIDYYEPPENLQIKIENKTEKKLKELERENALLKNKIPDLKIYFDNNEEYKEFTLKKIEYEDFDINARIEALKYKYPHTSKAKEINKSDNFLNNLLIDERAIDRYNLSLDRYYAEYKNYIEDLVKYAEFYNKSILINLILVNNGTVPAKDVLIDFHIPDGVDVITEKDLPNEPQEPEAPNLQTSYSLIDTYIPNINSLKINPIIPKFDLPDFDISALRIKKTNSYEINTRFPKLMHKTEVEINSFYFVFENPEKANSFAFTYSIIGENIPNRINGILSVKIIK